MWEFLIRKHGNAVVLLKVISTVVRDAEACYVNARFEAVTQIKNQVCLVLMRKLCRIKIELKMLYANRTNYLNCFLTCVFAGV